MEVRFLMAHHPAQRGMPMKRGLAVVITCLLGDQSLGSQVAHGSYTDHGDSFTAKLAESSCPRSYGLAQSVLLYNCG